MSYIKSVAVLRLLTRKFAPEIQKDMREAAELRCAGDGWESSQKIETIRKCVALPFRTRASVLLAWGLWTCAADSPLLFLGGVAAAILLPIQLILGAF